MTTDTLPSLRGYLGMRMVTAAKKKRRESALPIASAWQAIVRVVLHLAGFALLTIAAFEFNIIAGYAVAGISCFVCSTLMTSGGDERAGT